MLIIPERGQPRAKFLMPVPDRQWRAPSQRSGLYQIENQTRFRIDGRDPRAPRYARNRAGDIVDAPPVWRGWFDDRHDADAFLFALAMGNLHVQPDLWRLPTPHWHPDFGEHLTYEFATVTFLTATSGSNQTYTSDADWNNNDNSVELIAGGGAGFSNSAAVASGSSGGGGGYSKIVQFVFTVPGTDTAPYRLEAAPAVGIAGKDVWFNDTAFPSTGNGKVGAKGGGKGGAATEGVGGAAASGYAVNSDGSAGTKYSGGTSGEGRSTGRATGGAGGAGGPQGDGGDGGNCIGYGGGTPMATGGGGGNGGGGDGQNNSSSTPGAGGTSLNTGTGGTGGAENAAGGAGQPGNEWDSTHGSGGGSGGAGDVSANGTTPAANNYGGGASSGAYSAGVGASGTQGLIVLTSRAPTFIPYAPWQQRGPVQAQ